MSAREASNRRPSVAGASESLSTRVSQIERLRNLDDATSWTAFVGKYRGLISRLARRAGLREDEVADVVQETLVAVSRKMPEFVYDPARCSFQGWIRHVTACRISDRIRRRSRDPSHLREEGAGLNPTDAFDEMTDDRAEVARDEEWADEWRRHVLEQAMEQLATRVKPEHFQIFRMTFLNGEPPARVARTLGVMVAQVYLVRHRMARLLKTEVQRMCSETPARP